MAARRGELRTPAGSVTTPFFMPDATRASVRGITPEEIGAAGIGALVVNTYHLMLQPGEALVAKAGGIHRFMGWDGPTLSDSGGYQVYSLIHRNPEMGRITEDGAEFKSVLDGSKHLERVRADRKVVDVVLQEEAAARGSIRRGVPA